MKIKWSKINYKDLLQAKPEKEIILWLQNDSWNYTGLCTIS